MHYSKPRFSITDLIGLLSIGRATLYAEINAGRLKTYTVGKRRFCDPVEVDNYVRLCKTESESEA